MSDSLIVQQSDFEDLCDHVRQSGIVAFDTEFISEHTYRPELGLLQFATADRCVAVDPYEMTDLECWWEIMADAETTVVVHGGRAEIHFCLTLLGKAPNNLVDVQVAEGLYSPSFPLAYSALVKRVLGKNVHGKETRSDWKRRPLSDHQIHYALEDVDFLLSIWEKQKKSLDALGRLEWAHTEFQRTIDEVVIDLSRESWSRLSGIHKLNRRECAVAMALADWRDAEAARKNRPVKQVLRDDLLLELARRQPKTFEQLMATRDMNRRNYKQASSDLLACIEQAMAIPDSELPPRASSSKRDSKQDEHILGQLLGIALSNRCAELNVARSIVGTSDGLRQLVRWHLQDHDQGTPPALATGWRAEVCGNLLTDLLDGRILLRVSDPRSDHPLIFESTDSD